MANSRPDQYRCGKVKTLYSIGKLSVEQILCAAPGPAHFKTERIKPAAENLDHARYLLL